MFSSLRQGMSLYVLDKKDLTLKVGEIEEVGPLRNKFNIPVFVAAPDVFLDLRVKVDGEVVEYQKLGSQASIANSGALVISETKEAMANEVESMARQSQMILDSREYHEQVVERCSEFRKELNPQLAKEQERNERIDKLEDSLTDIKEMLAKVLKTSKNN